MIERGHWIRGLAVNVLLRSVYLQVSSRERVARRGFPHNSGDAYHHSVEQFVGFVEFFEFMESVEFVGFVEFVELLSRSS